MSEFIKALSGSLAFLPHMIMWYVVFAGLERLFPAAEHKSLKGWLFNISVSVLHVSTGMLAGIVGAVIGRELKAVLGGGLIDLRISDTSGVLGGLAATLLSLLVFDFFYYWWHRSQHTIPALWAVHKLHHLDEDVNVSTTKRQHWLEEIGRIPAIAIPMAVFFNLSPGGGGVIGLIVSSWGFFVHANVRLPFGWFSWLLLGPQLHRIHHSRLPEHFNCVYSAFFPIWDVIFGSYYHPRRGEFPPTGIAGEADTTKLVTAVLLPFRMWRDAFNSRNSRPVRAS